MRGRGGHTLLKQIKTWHYIWILKRGSPYSRATPRHRLLVICPWLQITPRSEPITGGAQWPQKGWAAAGNLRVPENSGPSASFCSLLVLIIYIHFSSLHHFWRWAFARSDPPAAQVRRDVVVFAPQGVSRTLVRIGRGRSFRPGCREGWEQEG